MVEVFKTDVADPKDACMLVEAIKKAFPGYKVNFDLQDCDHILRIESCVGGIQLDPIIRLINKFGYSAEVLPDEIPFLSDNF